MGYKADAFHLAFSAWNSAIAFILSNPDEAVPGLSQVSPSVPLGWCPFTSYLLFDR